MMESIEKLTELAEDINEAEIVGHMHFAPKFEFDARWLDSWRKAFNKQVEAVEAEIAERYTELPLDADGVPIHVGDMVYSASTPDGVKVGWVDSLSFCDTSASYRNAGAFRHKRRTVEDVLRDVARDSRSVRYEDGEGVLTDELIAQYANEIHGMVVGDIEDVLEDFLIAFDDWDWNTDSDDRDELRKELFSKYANIIRGVSE